MTAPNPSTALARTVVSALVEGGVDCLSLSPGSRSGALAIAAAEHPGLDTVVFLDERSAAFYALGRAKATSRPVAVLATSGTAVANWFPAVVEADSSGTPLILLSADRPAELRGVGANQTIDQVELFGNKVRSFQDIAAPGADDLVAAWRTAVGTGLAAAIGGGGPPGPAHLNIAFREPTVPVADDGRSRADPFRHDLATGADPLATQPTVGPPPTDVPFRRRGLVLAGDGRYDRHRVLDLAGRLGWPVLATALSGMRGGEVVGSYHHVLAGGTPPELAPEMVVAIGSIGPSPRLELLFGQAEIRLRVDRWGRRLDPGRNTTHLIHADPSKLLEMLIDRGDVDLEWSQAWHETGRAVREALDELIRASQMLTGCGVVKSVESVGMGALVAASSLPIREVDAHLEGDVPVFANRGASGIDGFISTALGVSSAMPRTVALAGDLSLLHDANGFLNDGEHDLVVVVVDNAGGGLFDRLPQRRYAPEFERLFIADQGRDFEHLARLHGLGHHRGKDMDDLSGTLEEALGEGGRHLIEVRVGRDDDLAMSAALDDAARSVLGGSNP